MKITNKIISIGSVVIAAGITAFMMMKPTEENAEMPKNTVPTEPNNEVDTERQVMGKQYKNGTYTAEGTYRSPAKMETIKTDIVLEDGVVKSAVFYENSTNEVSQKLQKMFKEGFEKEVVGKNIEEINLGVVNGSSLTPKGFMDALNKIKTEAQI